MLTLIVARYQEDVSWVNLIPANVVIVNKAQIGNTGREAASYLWFIATHYHALQGDYLFCQGDPFVHCPDFDARVGRVTPCAPDGGQGTARPTFGPRVTCDWNGAPHHPGLDIRRLAQQLDCKLPPLQLEFTSGAQFLRSAEEIHQTFCGLSYVHRMLAAANDFPAAPWIFERLWDYLIPTGNRQD